MPILNVFAIMSDHVNYFIPIPRDTGQEITCNPPALLDLAPCDPVHPIYSLVFPTSITVHVMSFPLSEGSLRFPHRFLLFGPNYRLAPNLSVVRPQLANCDRPTHESFHVKPPTQLGPRFPPGK